MTKSKSISQETLWLTFLLVGLVTVGVLVAVFAPVNQPKAESLSENSIYNPGPSGYKAWYLAAQKSGLPITPWEKGFDELQELPSPSAMLMVKPYTVSDRNVLFDGKAVARIMNWVGKGNTLILLDDFRRFGGSALLSQLNLTVKAATPLPPKSKAPTPALETLRLQLAPEAPQDLGAFIQAPLLSRESSAIEAPLPRTNDSQPLLRNRHGNTNLLVIPYRNGSLILGTISDLGENRYLFKPENDNYQFLTNLLHQIQKPVVVNEFVHGYMESGDLISYFQKKTPLGGIFAQFVMLFGVLLWLGFVRWTPKIKLPKALLTDEISTSETKAQNPYVNSMAGLYLKSQSSALALAPQLSRIQTLLKRRHRIHLDEEGRINDLLLAVFANYSNTQSNAQETPQAFVEALKLARNATEKQQTLSAATLLKTSQQLTIIEKRLNDGHPGPFSQRS